MRVLITGASGFVGQNLIKYFKENTRIETESLSLRRKDWEEKNFDGFDAIIHLAGKAHDTSNTSDPESYYRINRDLTIKLFEKFNNSNIRDFIFFSSVKAVADVVEGILTEERVTEPHTPYGKSKQEAENYLISANLNECKRVFILRPCMVHGPGNKGNLNLLYQVVEKGLPWPLASFKNERSFLSVDNLSFLVYQILDNKNLKSNTYNLADDDFTSTNELVDLISDVLGKKSKKLKISTSIVKSLVKVGDILPLPINSERLKKLTESYRVSNEKIKADLNLTKLPISAIEGLRRTIESFK